MEPTFQTMQGDCIEIMRTLPDASVDLVLADPPYNIKVRGEEWDNLGAGYIDWMIEWLLEAQRVLKPNGVLYIWHNDMPQIARLLVAMEQRTNFALMSFCVWDKGQYRAQSWKNRDPDSDTAPRSWFNVCEYCMHFFNAPKDADSAWKHTGLDRINSNPECYRPIKDWYYAELERLGITEEDVVEKYRQATGKSGAMFRHYFKDSQFAIPTEAVWQAAFEPLGFDATPLLDLVKKPHGGGSLTDESAAGGHDALRRSYDTMRGSYEAMREAREALRQSYEEMLNYHRCDPEHSNVWRINTLSGSDRIHICQKPDGILARIIRVSCRPGGVVLDPFMGSGSTGVACAHEKRSFIGIERDDRYFQPATDAIQRAYNQGVLDLWQ